MKMFLMPIYREHRIVADIAVVYLCTGMRLLLFYSKQGGNVFGIDFATISKTERLSTAHKFFVAGEAFALQFTG